MRRHDVAPTLVRCLFDVVYLLRIGHIHFIYEQVSSIRYKLAFAYSGDSNQFAHLHSQISLSFPPEGFLDLGYPRDMEKAETPDTPV